MQVSYEKLAKPIFIHPMMIDAVKALAAVKHAWEDSCEKFVILVNTFRIKLLHAVTAA